jgi:hypothetical protein
MNGRLNALWMLAAIGVAVTACRQSQVLPPTQSPNDGVATAVAQTLVALHSLTPSPTTTPTPPLPAATETPSPTATSSTTPTTTFTATSTPIPCNWAAFVTDVSVADGARLEPGETFTKTWRLRNIGRCTWEKGYRLVFSDGARMGGPDSIQLDKSVPVDRTIDISVRLKAPTDRGQHVGYWRLRSTSGELFGVGPAADQAIWVDITVVRPKQTVYNFVDQACTAGWSTNAGDLPCPGTVGAPEGFVVRLDDPKLEGGRAENEPGLWTRPPSDGDGWIRGEYPAFKVKEGDRFRALLACLDGAVGCKVKFLLQRRTGSDAIKTLASWTEKLDGEYHVVEFDLSSLEGKNVTFILALDTRGEANADEAVWVQPRIVR